MRGQAILRRAMRTVALVTGTGSSGAKSGLGERREPVWNSKKFIRLRRAWEPAVWWRPTAVTSIRNLALQNEIRRRSTVKEGR